MAQAYAVTLEYRLTFGMITLNGTADMVVVRTPRGMHVPEVLVGTSPESW